MNILYRFPRLFRIKRYFMKPFLKINKKQLFSFLSNSPQKILDVGCGYGYYSYEMSKLGHFVVGADPSTNLIKSAKMTYKNMKNLRFCVGGLPNLGFPDKKFDHVVLVDVLHHLPLKISFKECISECVRLSRKSVIIRDGLKPENFLLKVFIGALRYFTDCCKKHLTLEEFEDSLKEYKYELRLYNPLRLDMFLVIDTKR